MSRRGRLISSHREKQSSKWRKTLCTTDGLHDRSPLRNTDYIPSQTISSFQTTSYPPIITLSTNQTLPPDLSLPPDLRKPLDPRPAVTHSHPDRKSPTTTRTGSHPLPLGQAVTHYHNYSLIYNRELDYIH